jgi:hypothetical protein
VTKPAGINKMDELIAAVDGYTKCHNCGKFGHIQRDCKSPKKQPAGPVKKFVKRDSKGAAGRGTSRRRSDYVRMIAEMDETRNEIIAEMNSLSDDEVDDGAEEDEQGQEESHADQETDFP